MFVKKLVEIATKKAQPGGNAADGLKSGDVDPRVVFHYGIPSRSNKLAYDPYQKILAISTNDGRIKLVGEQNAQALLESNETEPSKFLQFIQDKGILLNITLKNHIEVWNIDKKLLSDVHDFKGEITSFGIMQHSPYMYVGDSAGNISVLKFDEDSYKSVKTNYIIPHSVSIGNPTEAHYNNAVVQVLPQPTSESKRVLIIFLNGHITLWGIQENRNVFSTGGNAVQSPNQENKKVTSACWVCPYGSKVAVGYSNGDILIWSIFSTLNLKAEVTSENSVPICKLNLGYKLDKNPIQSMRWVYAEGKASRLYVTGVSTNLLQAVLLNEHTETRTIKCGLHVSEPCTDIEIITDYSDQSKQRNDFLLVLGKSGHVYVYDDYLIEKHLLQSQARSPSLPKEVMMKMPFVDSSITVAKFITNPPHMLNSADEDYTVMAKHVPSLIPSDTKSKEGTQFCFKGFSMVKNLYITGHSDGTINIWDITCPFFIPIFSLRQQTEDDIPSSRAALTALHYDGNHRILVSGDHNGMVRIYKFKPDPYNMDKSFLSFQGNTKKGSNHIIHSVKYIKVNGAVTFLNINQQSRYLAVGTDQGYVSLVDIEGPSLLFQKHFAIEISPSIISLQFETCSLHNFEKNILVVATKDSSVFALDSATGNMVSTGKIHPKKPYRALHMQILDGWQDKADRKQSSLDDPVEDVTPKQLLLLCSEKAAYIFSLVHIVQGVKKVYHKKKFNSSSCCFASTFCCASGLGLFLLFSNGAIEIRSLPELSLLKETSIRGFTYSSPKANSPSATTICSSWDGDVIMVNGNQELFAVSVSTQKETFRLLDSASQVYNKDLMVSQDDNISGPSVPKEKKKGIFGSVFSSKGKPAQDVETEDTKESIEQLSTIFSTVNFRDEQAVDADEIDLDIDDIDLEEPVEQPKEPGMLTGVKKNKLASRLQSFKGQIQGTFKGKIKQMTAKNEKNITNKEEQQVEKGSALDQVKKKYGFSSSVETSGAKMAESKLRENVQKLQGINQKTAEMQSTAKSFSSMANELLRTVENHK